jgi:hypothetical protein
MPDLISGASRGKRIRPTQRSGVSGVAVRGGYIEDVETNPKLRGERKFRTYSELLSNVAIIGASVRYLLNLIGKAQWTVVPNPDGGARADDVAETVDKIIHDMARPWHRVVRRSSMYRFHGYAWSEWIAKKREDGSIGFFDIEPRSQATITKWDVDEAGIVYGVVQQSPHDFKEHYLSRDQAVYVVDDAISDSPDGLGILRHAFPAAETMQKYEQLEGSGFETDLRGVPIGKAPYSAIDAKVKAAEMTATEAALLVEVMESFVEDHVRGTTTGLVIDSEVYSAKGDTEQPSSTGLWGMDLLSSASTGQEAAAKAISRLTRAIALLFGTEGMLLGEGGGGSLALAKDKSNSFGLIVDGSLVEVSKQYEKDVIQPLGKMNGWGKELLPTFATEKLQHRDITEISDTLEGLARAGAPLMPDDPAVNIVRDALGLPEQETINLDTDSALRGAAGRKPKAEIEDDDEGEGEVEDQPAEGEPPAGK